MSEIQVQEINQRLAKEFIEERLDVPADKENINRLSACIASIEAKNAMVA